jgi:hypothetical protein
MKMNKEGGRRKEEGGGEWKKAQTKNKKQPTKKKDKKGQGRSWKFEARCGRKRKKKGYI